MAGTHVETIDLECSVKWLAKHLTGKQRVKGAIVRYSLLLTGWNLHLHKSACRWKSFATRASDICIIFRIGSGGADTRDRRFFPASWACHPSPNQQRHRPCPTRWQRNCCFAASSGCRACRNNRSGVFSNLAILSFLMLSTTLRPWPVGSLQSKLFQNEFDSQCIFNLTSHFTHLTEAHTWVMGTNFVRSCNIAIILLKMLIVALSFQICLNAPLCYWIHCILVTFITNLPEAKLSCRTNTNNSLVCCDCFYFLFSSNMCQIVVLCKILHESNMYTL